MTEKAEQIAAKLSETMRDALLAARIPRSGADYRVLSEYTSERTRKALKMRGLVRASLVLSDLGLAVREILIRESQS